MATIDSNIYVAGRSVVGLDDEADGVLDFHQALEEEAERATAITILGGYFTRNYLLGLLRNVPHHRRQAMTVQIAIGIEPARSTVMQWAELRQLREDLQSDGFEHAVVKAVQNSRHFHTKLYYFLRATQPSWYVGSANPTGSGRHEMMVRVGRSHPALSAYANAVWNAARHVEQEEAQEEIGTLFAFFAAGFVVFSPPFPQLFVFDAFRFKPEERRRLEEGAGKLINVPFASVKTEGYGFRLAEALGASDVQAVDSGDETELARNIRYRDSSVETVFGYWMPAPYKREIEQAVRVIEDRRASRMTALVRKLANLNGKTCAHESFKIYAESLNSFARVRRVEERSLRDCIDAFNTFLTRRASLARYPERIGRHCRKLVFTPMPDLSNDENAAREFRESFFEDIAARAGGNHRGRVIRSIIEGIREPPGDALDPDEWLEKLETRLSDRPWISAEWLGQHERGRGVA